jgi:PAS domain S-box-containing protein
MKLSLSKKLFLHIALTVLIALGINSYLQYYQFKKEYLNQFHNTSIKDFLTIEENIQTQKVILKEVMDFIKNDERVINTLNLISKYEKNNQNEHALFDEEKRSLLMDLNAKLNSIAQYSFGIFDKNKVPVVINRSLDENSMMGYYHYIDKNHTFVNLLDNTTVQPTIRPLYEKNINHVHWFEDKNSLSLVLYEKLFFNEEHIGYVRVKKRFTVENIQFLTLGLDSLFAFVMDSAFVLGNINDINTALVKQHSKVKDEDEFGRVFYSDANYYYHSYFNTINGKKKLYFVLAKAKSSLDNQFIQLIQQLLFSFLIALVVAFIVSLVFLKINILKPLYELIEGIKHLKNKGFTPIDIQSSNEFKDIAHEFNSISYELSQSFEALEASKLFLERLIDSVPVRIFWKDLNGNYLGANDLFVQDTGVKSKAELLGITDYDLPWTKEEADAFRADDLEVMTLDKPKKNFEELQTSPIGIKRVLLTSKVPLKNGEGEIIGLLGVYYDITTMKQLQKELKDKELLLMHQSKMAAMGEMLENIAHQWKQPLSLISTISSGLKLKLELNDLNNEYLIESTEQIMQATKLLSNTVDDFRDFYKKDKTLKRFNLSNIIEKTTKLFSSKIKNRDIDLVLELGNYEIVGYENEFVQVVLNILHNAIDALDAASVVQKVIKISIKQQDNYINVVFQDSAQGIKKEILPKVFDARFTTKEKQGGSGIGLYMSKLILDKVGATIKAENCTFEYNNSELNGACFTIAIARQCEIGH